MPRFLSLPARLLAGALAGLTVATGASAEEAALAAAGERAPATGGANDPNAAPAPPAVTHETESRAHFLGLLYDQGTESALGARYVHAWESGASRGGLGYAGWLGLGLDGRLVTHDFQSVDGGLAYLVARVSGVGDAGGFGLEVAAGAGAGRSTSALPVAAPGVFFGLYYLELGYSYQFPLPGFARPEWLSSHQFSIRIHVPLHRYAEREWDDPGQH